MNFIKLITIFAILLLLNGCNNHNIRYVPQAEIDRVHKQNLIDIQIDKQKQEQSGMTWNEYVDYKRSGKIPESARKKQNQAEIRIAAYETNYINEYINILKTIPEAKTTYIQPYNKKEPCKIWFSYYENDKWFEEDSYKIAWDGQCKNGFASGLGREIETADMMDKWGIAIYKKGKPTYYVINDVLSNSLFEGIDR